MYSGTCEPSPHFNWSIKARACDWAVEGKGGTGGLRVGTGREKSTEEEEQAMMDQNHVARRNHE